MDREQKIREAYALLEGCTVCPRECGVDRTSGEVGFCRVEDELMVSSYGPHLGEEPELVVRHGSGTIFLTGCNLGCLFCQNADISQRLGGKAMSVDECVDIMLGLETAGCHNINFVTPTHFAPHVMDAIARARGRGLAVPIVYNCGGYESLEMLRLLEGFVDIYMPDLKFMDADAAERLAQAGDYPHVAMAALKEMHRQVGDLEVGDDGAARRGLLVRHLVMPGGLAGTAAAMRFLAEDISPATYVNVMAQFRPCHRATEIPAISNPLGREDYLAAVDIARDAGLSRGF
jgi:putative pyruvate formate lyase activating enzyme